MTLEPFKYGDYNATIDFSDFSVVDKFESAIKELDEDIKSANSKSQYIDIVKGLFYAITNLFDSTLGEGASNEILGSSTGLNSALDALQALVDYRHQQGGLLTQAWKSIAKQYSPQRRDKK